MHIPTHIMSGWVLGNCVPLTKRERLHCMLAASLADLDGLGVVFGTQSEAYQRWHHVACHGIVFGVFLSGVLTVLSPGGAIRRAGVFAFYLLIFHVHLVMDYFGSGAGWPIVYFYPISDWKLVNWDAWELSSWQNSLAAGVLLAITVLIAVVKRRTPLELLMPSLDEKFTRRRSSKAPA
jgi:inner membrane protein